MNEFWKKRYVEHLVERAVPSDVAESWALAYDEDLADFIDPEEAADDDLYYAGQDLG